MPSPLDQDVLDIELELTPDGSDHVCDADCGCDLEDGHEGHSHDGHAGHNHVRVAPHFDVETYDTTPVTADVQQHLDDVRADNMMGLMTSAWNQMALSTQGSVDGGDMRNMLEAAVASGLVDMDLGGLTDYVAQATGIASADIFEALDEILTSPTVSFSTLAADSPDVRGNTNSRATIDVGELVYGATGVIGDEDWYKVTLEAGTEYVMFQTVAATDPHENPWLRLYSEAGRRIDENDDAGSNNTGEGDDFFTSVSSMLFFTPDTTGDFWVSAGGYYNNSKTRGDTGEYALFVGESTDRPDVDMFQIAAFLTDGFDDRGSWEGDTISYYFDNLPGAAEDLFVQAMEAWEAVTDLTFVASSRNDADILYIDSDDGAYASSTGTIGGFFTGQTTVNVASDWTGSYDTNDYRYQTYVHEIGHALGLGHGGPYNSNATEGRHNLFGNDSWNTTIMSYFDQFDSGFGTPRFALGPQIADIIAIHDLYGVSTTARVGDTVYGFNSTETDVFNYQTWVNDGIRIPALSIFDSSGEDTIDLSGFAAGQTLNLNQGTFSDIGDNYLITDSDVPLEAVLSIAPNADIENAIGGSGDDTLIGNALDNDFTGNAGDDLIFGGDGIDRAIYAGNSANYTITAESDTVFLISGAQGTDRLTNVEFVVFADGQSELRAEQASTFTNENDTGQGTESDDILDGLAGDDFIDGLGGNDTIYGNSGNDTLTGGAGDDVVIADFAAGLTGVEGQVFRAYQAVFDRNPDLGGFNTFTNEIRLGNLTQESVIADFVGSTEFEQTYGDLQGQAFIEQLYLNVLNRPGDDAGITAFTNELASGRSRESIVVEFAESAEFINLMTLPSAAFATNATISATQGDVYRFYQAAFDRAPDVGGFQVYVNSVLAGVLSREDVAAEFIASTEYQNTYSNQSNSDFVTLLYANVLDRTPDSVGLSNYVNSLEAGVLTREDVFLEFADSAEFFANTQPAASAFVAVANDFASDTLVDDSGGDQYFGGEGRDEFIFDFAPNSAAELDVILDFTSGLDLLSILGNPTFDTFAEVQAAMTQVDNDTLIDMGSAGSIRLDNVVATDLTADDFNFGNNASRTLDTDAALLAAVNPFADDSAQIDAMLLEAEMAGTTLDALFA